MAIKFQCPQCHRGFTVKDEHGGRKAKCPCGAKIIVPIEDATLASSTNRKSATKLLENGMQQQSSSSIETGTSKSASYSHQQHEAKEADEDRDPFQFFPKLEKRSPELAGLLSTIVIFVMVTVGWPACQMLFEGKGRQPNGRTVRPQIAQKTPADRRAQQHEQRKMPAAPPVKKRPEVPATLDIDGVYSAVAGSGGSYKDRIHGFFEVEPPNGYRVEEQRSRTTTRLDNGTVVPCSRIQFQSRNDRIAVVTRKTLRGNIDDDLPIVLHNYRLAGAKVERTRFVKIDGIRGAEVLATASGFRLMCVKYKKHGLDHAITMSCSPRNFPILKQEFVRFLQSYRSLQPQ